MVNPSKREDERFWRRWKQSGAIGDINGRDYGMAYAFFDCKASTEEIMHELPLIMELAQTPKKLELILAPVAPTDEATRQGLSAYDPELSSIFQYAEEAGLQYALVAKALPTTTNRETADELANILNQAYQSPLYKPEEKEPFRGGIFYEEGGSYVSRD